LSRSASFAARIIGTAINWKIIATERVADAGIRLRITWFTFRIWRIIALLGSRVARQRRRVLDKTKKYESAQRREKEKIQEVFFH
jgi:hypothetical protein